MTRVTESLEKESYSSCGSQSPASGVTVAFIAYLVAGPAGAVIAVLGTFLPCYLLVVQPASRFRKWAKNPQLKSFVSDVTAAATAAIAGAAFELGRRALIDLSSTLIALVTLGLLFLPKKIPEPLVIVAAGAVGPGIRGVVSPH